MKKLACGFSKKVKEQVKENLQVESFLELPLLGESLQVGVEKTNRKIRIMTNV